MILAHDMTEIVHGKSESATFKKDSYVIKEA